jgi:hypothetical protein
VEGSNEVKIKVMFDRLKVLYDRFYGRVERRKVEQREEEVQVELQNCEYEKLRRQDRRKMK